MQPRVIESLMFDEDNLEHIAGHGVDQIEVEEACFPPDTFFRGRGQTMLVLGRTDSDRLLAIVLAPRGHGAYYVVTARDMNSTERRRYRAHKR